MSIFYGIELPLDVVKEIVTFISDPLTVCRLACSCRSFHNILANDDQIWERLFHLRWKQNLHPSSSRAASEQQQHHQRLSSPQNKSNNSNLSERTFLQKYQHRHKLDHNAWVLLHEMATCLLQQEPDDQTHNNNTDDHNNNNSNSIIVVNENWSNILGKEWEHDNWTKLRSRAYGNAIEDLLRAIVHENWMYPSLREEIRCMGTPTGMVDESSLSANNASSSSCQKLIWNVTQSLAGIALDAIHHYRVMNEWHTLIHSLSLTLAGTPSYTEDVQVLEKGILLLAKSQMDIDTIVSCRDGPERILNHVISQLDDIGQQFQQRLNDNGITTTKTLQAVTILNDMLVEEMGFEGNLADYYNVSNSLIDVVLQSRKGIPITFAVLYKCICHRVGIQVDIIGLPGHVVLGIPSLGRGENNDAHGGGGGGQGQARLNLFDETENESTPKFVDVFSGGQILSLEECQSIAASYGHPWRDEFIRPLTATEALSRMLNNVMSCYSKQFELGKSAKLALSVEKVRALSMVTQLHYTPHAYMLLEIWPERMPLVLDPDVFMRFGVC